MGSEKRTVWSKQIFESYNLTRQYLKQIFESYNLTRQYLTPVAAEQECIHRSPVDLPRHDILHMQGAYPARPVPLPRRLAELNLEGGADGGVTRNLEFSAEPLNPHRRNLLG